MKKITMLCVWLFCLTMNSALSQINAVSIVGDAVGGWPTGTPGEVDAHQMSTMNGFDWSFNDLVVSAGGLKFRANNAWSLNWGAANGQQTGSLTGVASLDGPNFTLTPGTYDVTFNSTSGAYVFVAHGTGYASISILGDAFGDWNTDIPLITNNGSDYYIEGLDAVAGGAKFRQNGSWETSWGANTFPTGFATLGGDNIPVNAGRYNIQFNKDSGHYMFSGVNISLVGSSTPGGWPSGSGVDPHSMNTEDGENYFIPSIELTTSSGGETGVKFRQNFNWNVNWGSSDFPVGVATLNGSNIPTTAGTYSVHFNIFTGAYRFEAPMSVDDTTNSRLSIYPNPTRNQWHVHAVDMEVLNVKVTDLSGKIVWADTSRSTVIPAEELAVGLYIATVETSRGTIVQKLIKI